MVTAMTADVPAARQIAEAVADPELPMLTLADLGILRDVTSENGHIVVTITPTYSGCPALREIARDLETGSPGRVRGRRRPHPDRPGLEQRLDHPGGPPEAARGRHRATGPGKKRPSRPGGPRPGPAEPHHGAPGRVPCPQCGSPDTEQTAAFGATACKALMRCRSCHEPFEYVKEF